MFSCQNLKCVLVFHSGGRGESVRVSGVVVVPRSIPSHPPTHTRTHKNARERIKEEHTQIEQRRRKKRKGAAAAARREEDVINGVRKAINYYKKRKTPQGQRERGKEGDAVGARGSEGGIIINSRIYIYIHMHI